MHPLLVHFPIALVLLAMTAETVAWIRGDAQWRVVATVNLRVAAFFAVLTVIAGWRLAAVSGDPAPLLKWHQWLGVSAALATITAALATLKTETRSAGGASIYRTALVCAAALVAVTAHLGGLLVWGADFLRP